MEPFFPHILYICGCDVAQQAAYTNKDYNCKNNRLVN